LADSFSVYAIEATVHAPSFEGIYGEIYKILKPGGVVSLCCSPTPCRPAHYILVSQFGVYEWVMTDDWDPSIPEHKAIAHGIEIGDGIAEMRNIAAARKALNTVGYIVEMDDDLADKGDEVPWYYPLEVIRFIKAPLNTRDQTC